MRAIRVLVFLLLSMVIILSSCDIINPPEDVPTFIKIDTFKVIVKDIDQGAATHQITNCYLNVGGANVGIFQMPFEIPCLETGMQTVHIRPGIKLNGISASRIDYPFFKPYIIDFELRENETHLFAPETTYKEECVFAWKENFEDAGLGINYADYSDTTIISQNDVLRSGRYSGAIFVDEENALFDGFSTEFYELPQNGGPVLMELDYKNNNGFEIGMYFLEDGATEWFDLIYINPSDVWKRIYVDVGSYTSNNPTVDKFRMGIRVFYELENNETGKVYLDNIKLIHF